MRSLLACWRIFPAKGGLPHERSSQTLDPLQSVTVPFLAFQTSNVHHSFSGQNSHPLTITTPGNQEVFIITLSSCLESPIVGHVPTPTPGCCCFQPLFRACLPGVLGCSNRPLQPLSALPCRWC